MSMLCYATLRYATPRYATLCYAMLCYAMLCYAMLCYAMIYKGAAVTSNTTNIAMLTTSWDPKDSFYDGNGAARSLSKCLPLKAGNTIFRNEYWTWPTHGPNNYELMDVVGMLGIVLWSHVTETSFSKTFSFPKRSDRQRQTTREPSKNMLWDPTARGMLKK